MEVPLIVNNYFDNIVWESGIFKHHINKIYSSTELFIPTNLTPIVSLDYTEVHLLINQGFSFDTLFGVHLIIKNETTNEIYVSKIYKIEDFSFTGNSELINGSFWQEEIIVNIPQTKDILSCQVTEISFDNINNITGYVYNYPFDFITLISEKPVPDYIQTILELTDSLMLKVSLKTLENKTFEQSLLDYFGLKTAQIDISHLITYGNDNLGYYALRISNETNKYLPIVVGLDYNTFNIQNPNALINIIVTTEILVDGKLIRRDSTLTTDLSTINTLITSKIEHPNTNYPVEVVKQNVITQTVIETKEVVKVVPIYQPIFSELITTSIKYEKKNIYFDNVTKPTFLSINKSENDNQQVILSKTSSDNKVYFNLMEINPLTMDSTYELIDANSMQIVGKGVITYS